MSESFRAAAGELAKLQTAYERLCDAYDGRPAPDSPALKERATDPVNATRWGQQPVRDAYRLAEVLLVAAFDHLQALEILLEADAAPTFAT